MRSSQYKNPFEERMTDFKQVVELDSFLAIKSVANVENEIRSCSCAAIELIMLW